MLLMAATSSVMAHAFLDRAEPRVGNSVAAPPHAVTLWFSQKIEPAFSSVTVTNAKGERVDTGKARVNGNQMSVSLRGNCGRAHVPCSRCRTRFAFGMQGERGA
jgi:methionine-rich copper-binding protein CopC